ncbi:hypothetical protein G7K_2726-t1 [Saitoella complicata NRRL Y-17804]|uniref:Uncharacterized protein n=1 Tax=Saitoella complicata (strain BCRC 22490 / CBS 7301 / JCM 7358 / NBRC 10748 / NRRL Y-17804) TaxID=698492 RepID=A0A0E9NFG0_SAICN|nr:hypothetical protein G7K_2726-t1 [Saitoella complicata NRRL Y-17804]
MEPPGFLKQSQYSTSYRPSALPAMPHMLLSYINGCSMVYDSHLLGDIGNVLNLLELGPELVLELGTLDVGRRAAAKVRGDLVGGNTYPVPSTAAFLLDLVGSLVDETTLCTELTVGNFLLGNGRVGGRRPSGGVRLDGVDGVEGVRASHVKCGGLFGLLGVIG